MSDSRQTRYREAGVDIDAGKALAARIEKMSGAGNAPGILANPGGFAALFDLGALHCKRPLLVSGCDGVGTKLQLAMEHSRHDQIGIDLVAMCVNDVLVYGARPLFFLDYYACGRLEPAVAESVIRGIHEGCGQAGCALVGGETAELPGMYGGGEYELAGFCVGVVEKERLIDGRGVCPGDALLALPSSGCHANGYALIRKILAAARPPASARLLEQLLTPTRIYSARLLPLLEQFPIKALAHITGGGLQENLPRTLPPELAARVDTSCWTLPEPFRWLQEKGNISPEEMYRTFNCGVGMTLCVPARRTEELLSALSAAGEKAWQLGEITSRGKGPAVQYV